MRGGGLRVALNAKHYIFVGRVFLLLLLFSVQWAVGFCENVCANTTIFPKADTVALPLWASV